MVANRSVSSATFPVHPAAGGHPPLVTSSEVIRPTITQGLAEHIHLNPFDWRLTAEVLDLDELKRSLGSAPAVEFNAEGGFRWAAKWDQLEARWNAVLGLEATIDTLRSRLNGISGEMEVSLRRVLTTEEKPHASAADLAQWTKAKSRVHLILPKARDFIQRAAWTKGTPERQRLDEFLLKNADGVSTPAREMDQVLEELELLLENLKLLIAQGCSVSNECKSVWADVQVALRRMRPAKWQQLEARWRGVLGLEATIETLRIRLKALWAEMEASLKMPLPAQEKLHASAADVSQWTKAKTRVYSTLPRAKDFIRRASWATGTPERRRLGEFFKHADGFSIPCTERDEMLEELEVLRQNLQGLSTRGWAVSNECKSVSAGIQQALSNLQSSSAARGAQKRGVTRARFKYA